MVECDLAKVEVVGSNPISRSRILFPAGWCSADDLCRVLLFAAETGARYPSGKGEVCKTFMRRFDSDPRLHSSAPLSNGFIIGNPRLALTILAGVCLVLSGFGCSSVRTVGDRHPDEVLFEQAMEAAEGKRFAVAHLTLETLVNTYPESTYAEKARLALRDPRIARCGGWTSTPCELAEPVWQNGP